MQITNPLAYLEHYGRKMFYNFGPLCYNTFLISHTVSNKALMIELTWFLCLWSYGFSIDNLIDFVIE